MAKMTPQQAVKAHEAKRHKGEPKTFKKGGKTDADMLKYGRGMAKVMNQKVAP
jgi:hypothetical protein